MVQAVVAEVHDFCVTNADPALVRKYARFFKEGYDAYGVDSKLPAWAEHRDDWIRRLSEAGPKAVLEAGDQLIATGKYEEIAFAVLFTAAIRDRYTPAMFAHIGKWFNGNIKNWAHVDIFCAEVLSKFLADEVIDLSTLAAWGESEFEYKRRAVPVAMIPLLKVREDFAPLLAVIEPMMKDPERVVHQGLGWFLREAWKRQPKPIEKFLLRHKNTAPRLIFQYATEKMTPEQRERFRRAK